MVVLHLFDQIQAVTTLQSEIDDDQVGSALPDGQERGLRRGSFPADREVGLAFAL
jgi:hypothetical protein